MQTLEKSALSKKRRIVYIRSVGSDFLRLLRIGENLALVCQSFQIKVSVRGNYIRIEHPKLFNWSNYWLETQVVIQLKSTKIKWVARIKTSILESASEQIEWAYREVRLRLWIEFHTLASSPQLILYLKSSNKNRYGRLLHMWFCFGYKESTILIRMAQCWFVE